MLTGLLGVVLGGLGAQLSAQTGWIRFFDNLHWTFSTSAVAIIAWLKYKDIQQQNPKSFLWISIGLTGYAIGQILWDIQVAVGYSGFPAPSDAFYLLLGPGILLGLIVIILDRATYSNRRLILLDTLIIVVAMVTIVLVNYLPKRGNTDLLPLIILIAYPVTLLSAAITSLSMIPVLRLRITLSLISLIVGLFITGLSWMNWNLLALKGETIDGDWFNITFSVAILFIGYGLSQWTIERNESVHWDRLCEGVLRQFPMVAVVIAASAVILSDVFEVSYLVEAITATGMVIVVILAMIRQSYMLQERDALLNAQTELAANKLKLRASEKMMKGIVENIPAMVFVKRASDLRIELLNRNWQLVTGYSSEDFLGKSDYDLWPKEQADAFTAADRKVLASYEVTEIPEEKLTNASGQTIHLQTWKVALRDENEKPTHLLGVAIDITARKRTEEALRVAAIAFETHEGIMITDVNGKIVRVNQAFQDMTGYSAEEVIGNNPRMLSSGRHSKDFYEAMWSELERNGTWSGEIWDKRKSGQIYPKWQTITAVRDDKGNVTEYVAISSDITSRKQAEEDIHSLAYYDSLTGLPNRRLLMDRMRSALAGSARGNLYGAVLFLDMDRFKTLNDSLGHDVGDQLLVEVGRRIQACVREVDSVSRLGGDEFVILLEEVDAHIEEASRKASLIAEKIRIALVMPYQLNYGVHHSSPSIGVCLFHGNGTTVDTLLKHADMAMYQAKESGRNSIRFFDPTMQHAVESRAALEADLRHALPDQQLQLYYQLQVDGDLRAIGAEALLRWKHPVQGMVSPAKFIPLAEESSLILDLGSWVLETACKQLRAWAGQDMTRNLTLAVNVSAKQFRQPDFVDKVAAILRKFEVAPSRLKLELTESVVLNDVSDVVAKMHALKALGLSLSLDDFGTGYSSLSYLKTLPLDQIKIDQSFVRDITTDPNDAVMVKSIIDMAQNFRLNVIAEGVETDSQLEFLKKNGCMAYQGYLFSKPVSIEQFEDLLKSD